MRAEYLWITVVAITWGGYPLMARAAGQQGPLGPVLLMLGGLIPVCIAWQVLPAPDTPSQGFPTLLLLAGVAMGIGLTAYHAVLTSPMHASLSIPIINVSMLLVSTVGAVIAFAEPVSIRKLVATALLVAGIALLQGSD